ncbi:MAG: hypothetical protein WC911_10870 [Thermoleophilia bacterium]
MSDIGQLNYHASKLSPEKRATVESLAAAIVSALAGDYSATNYFSDLIADRVCLSCGSSTGRPCECENDQ